MNTPTEGSWGGAVSYERGTPLFGLITLVSFEAHDFFVARLQTLTIY